MAKDILNDSITHRILMVERVILELVCRVALGKILERVVTRSLCERKKRAMSRRRPYSVNDERSGTTFDVVSEFVKQ